MEKSSKSADKISSILTPKKTVGSFFITLILNIIVALIVWPLLDLFWCGVITRSPFAYSVVDHVAQPITFMVFITICEFLFFNSAHKDKTK